jgi:hypothetical protein
VVPSLAHIADLNQFMLGQRRINQEAEGTARLQHRTIAGMLRQQWSLALAAWPQPDARPPRIGKETDFHPRSI